MKTDIYIFLIIPRSVLLRTKNVSNKKVKEQLKTHISCSVAFFSKTILFKR